MTFIIEPYSGKRGLNVPPVNDASYRASYYLIMDTCGSIKSVLSHNRPSNDDNYPSTCINRENCI